MSAKRKLRRALRQAYTAPEPERKQEFLRSMGEERCSAAEFFVTQLGYIRRQVWIVSALLFLAALWACSRIPGEAVWIVSAGTPFLALTILTENAKSEACGMAELEAVTRFSLKSVLLARMSVLAAAHGLLLFVLILFSSRSSFLPTALGGLYILVPYLLTAYIGTAALRRLHGRETTYACIGIAAFVSAILFVMRDMEQLFYSLRAAGWWAAALFLLTAALLRENYLFYKQTEELSWNSQ